MSDNKNNTEELDIRSIEALLSEDGPNDLQPAKVNEPILPELLHKALIVNDVNNVKDMANENSAIPLAEALNALTDNEVIIFYSMVNDTNKLGEIFPYLSVEKRIALCENLSKKNIVAVLDAVVDDDLADFVEDLTKSLREKVLSYLTPKRKKTIQELASYSDDTIGSIMTTEYLSVPINTKIRDVFKKIKEIGKTLETVRTIFVVDDKNNNVLLGTKRLEDLMFEDESQTIDSVMNKDFPYISPIAYKEEAIPICKEYDLPVLPVVSKDGYLLGIVTFDDVLDVIEEKNTEDVYRSGAVTPTEKPYMETKAYRMAFSYVVWLIILLIINTFTTIIVNNFESALMTLPVLISFLPALNDTGGNSGDQTTSTITRALSTGEITVKDYWKVVSKEALAGLMTASIVALFNFGWVFVELYGHLINVSNPEALATYFGSIHMAYFVVSLVVSIALFFAVFLSKVAGATLPILAKLCHIDPAIMSGPLIASLMDIITLLIYFSTSMIIINHFDPGLIETGYVALSLFLL